MSFNEIDVNRDAKKLRQKLRNQLYESINKKFTCQRCGKKAVNEKTNDIQLECISINCNPLNSEYVKEGLKKDEEYDLFDKGECFWTSQEHNIVALCPNCYKELVKWVGLDSLLYCLDEKIKDKTSEIIEDIAIPRMHQ